MEKVKILVADDHLIVLEGIKSALREYPEFQIIDEANTGREAVQKVKAHRPDIVIMDISMPDLNGIDAMMQIRNFDSTIKIIIFTMHSYPDIILEVIKAGVFGYVSKDESISKLVLAVKAAKEGGSYFSANIHSIISEQVHLQGQKPIADGDSISSLSLREREVFQLLAEGKTSKQIAQLLHLSPKTVDNHKYSIMHKLGLQTRTDLTKLAIRKNMILF